MSDGIYLSGGDLVHWDDGCGGHQVGRIALVYQRHSCSRPSEASMCVAGPYCHLVQHIPTGELEWVPADNLKPYPESPIPEPAK